MSEVTHPVCLYCEEPVLPGEEAEGHTPPCHYECVFRAASGSVAHILKLCSCYVPGSEEGDPPGMTKREAAHAALVLWQAKERVKARENDNVERMPLPQTCDFCGARLMGSATRHSPTCPFYSLSYTGMMDELGRDN